ncbi:sensor histidine kinase [Luteococcus sp. Sow4_B9]|uniref:sensor histidine kinase n=1 Tax=Luteococcus sp. Sow4_B9 TaxID=3438792 RepID=UPI003F9E0BF9
MAPLPASQTGVAFHSCLIPTFSFARRGRSLRACGWAVVALVVATGKTSREVTNTSSLLSYSLAWLVLLVLAGLAGHLIHATASAAASRRAAELLEQRRALARQLHDTVAHDLAVIAMTSQRAQLDGHLSAADLETIAASSRRGSTTLRSTLDLLISAQQEPFREPTSTSPFPTLIASRANYLERLGFQVNVDLDGDWSTVDATTAQCFSHVLQEAINNVEKHADRTKPVALLVEVTHESVSLVVLNQATAHTTRLNHNPLGLKAMKQRLQGLGGSLEAGLHETTWTLRATSPLLRL